MRQLPRPTVTVREALDRCLESIRDPDLVRRLRDTAVLLEGAEQDYLAHGEAKTFYQIAGTAGVGGLLTTAEMERVYERTFVRSARTRKIYDALKKLPENDVCPLCGQRTVFTLDHYLPQSGHPLLAITSINLVAACGECNKVKLALQANSAEEQTIHPYFDDMDDGRWLSAVVKEVTPAALVFSANPPAGWGEVKRRRAIKHFEVFELAKLYASHSAVELNNIRYGLQLMATRNSPQEIREHLRGCADSCAAAYPNSWQRATYEALADSDWFCSGGFA